MAAIHPRDIGTDLLRTLITVVEERSYTKAAIRLGLSQPTVSAHIKRLQEQLGFELFDKSVPGVILTAQGELTLIHARQILSIHNQLIQSVDRFGSLRPRIRLGIPDDIHWDLTSILAELRKKDADLGFHVERGGSTQMLEKFYSGEIDVCAAMQLQEPGPDAYFRWREMLVWAGVPNRPMPTGPLDIIAPPQDGICRDIMINTLEQSGSKFRIVVDTDSIEEAINAAAAGLGYVSLVRSNVQPPLRIVDPGNGLPMIKIPYFWGIFVNAQTRSGATEQLADSIARRISGQFEITSIAGMRR